MDNMTQWLGLPLFTEDGAPAYIKQINAGTRRLDSSIHALQLLSPESGELEELIDTVREMGQDIEGLAFLTGTHTDAIADLTESDEHILTSISNSFIKIENLEESGQYITSSVAMQGVRIGAAEDAIENNSDRIDDIGSAVSALASGQIKCMTIQSILLLEESKVESTAAGECILRFAPFDGTGRKFICGWINWQWSDLRFFSIPLYDIFASGSFTIMDAEYNLPYGNNSGKVNHSLILYNDRIEDTMEKNGTPYAFVDGSDFVNVSDFYDFEIVVFYTER